VRTRGGGTLRAETPGPALKAQWEGLGRVEGEAALASQGGSQACRCPVPCSGSHPAPTKSATARGSGGGRAHRHEQAKKCTGPGVFNKPKCLFNALSAAAYFPPKLSAGQ